MVIHTLQTMEKENMKILHYENIARWFTLTVDAESGFPGIRIYDDVLAKLNTFKPEIIASIRKNLGLSKLAFPYQDKPGETFGFGNGIRRVGSLNEQTTYQFILPVIHRYTDKPCQECGGVKNSDCHYCSGSGKDSIVLWEEAFALSASISLMVSLLEFACEITRPQVPDRKKQILTVHTFTDRGMNGGSLGGSFSPYFVNFLKSHGEDASYDYAAAVMLRAYRHMWQTPIPKKGSLDFVEYGIRAGQNLRGNLMLDVPGDACGIHPSPYVHEIPEGEGVEFTCHNVDSPLQQLTLLTGLAAMCDLVG